MDDRIASRQWRTVAIDSSGWWLAGSGCGVWGGENEIKRKKNENEGRWGVCDSGSLWKMVV